LHPEASKIIGKGWSGKHAKDYIPELYHNIWKGQISQHLAFIVGLPYDTKENCLDTVKWWYDNNLDSIDFRTLGVYGTNNGTSRLSLYSDFDLNPEKYSFSFDSDPLQTVGGVMISWKNRSWSVKTADDVRSECLRLVAPKSTVVFMAPSIVWLGYTNEFVRSTAMQNLPWDEIKIKSELKFQEYFEKLTGL